MLKETQQLTSNRQFVIVWVVLIISSVISWITLLTWSYRLYALLLGGK